MSAGWVKVSHTVLYSTMYCWAQEDSGRGPGVPGPGVGVPGPQVRGPGFPWGESNVLRTPNVFRVVLEYQHKL